MKKFVVFSEDWKKEKVCKTLKEAKAYRYQEYGYAGYILEYKNGAEIANHS